MSLFNRTFSAPSNAGDVGLSLDVVVQPGPEDRDRARLVVACHAFDHADLSELLQILGLLDGASDAR